MFEYIREGNKIEITMKDGGANQSFASQVDEAKKRDDILIVMPVMYNRLIKLPVGEHYNMLFHTQQGMFSFDASVTGYTKDGNINLLKVKLNDEGKRIVRRSHFRFKVEIPVKITRLNDELLDLDVSQEILLDGIVKNLSGGGMILLVDDDIPNKQRVKCLLNIEGQLIIILGTVLDRLNARRGKDGFEYRVMFSGLTQADEDIIVQYVFTEQRKELQRFKEEKK
jgi:c-di-GMP-binding flagellar brake protein YcgR